VDRQIDLAPTSVVYIHRVFSLIMQLAARDRRIPSNPAIGVKLHKIEESDKIFLSAEQLHTLAEECGDYQT
jgi:hypothetical protein